MFKDKPFLSTLDNQDLLPPYPLQSLESTISLYLETIEPFVPELITQEQFEETKKIALDFVNGDGRRLQAALMNRAIEKKNWLEEWWLKYAYHFWPNPLPINSNYFGLVDPDFLSDKKISQLDQASRVLWCYNGIRSIVVDKMIPPQYMRGGTVPLDMDCYTYMYGSRIPGEQCDSFMRVESPKRQCVVISNGQFYTFDMEYEDGTLLSAFAIKKQLSWIQQDSEKSIPDYSLCALTTQDRREWASQRKEMLAINPINEKIINEIDTSMVVCTLDNRSPDLNTAGYISACDAEVWWDHISSLVFYKNGYIGCEGEHSPCDAPYIAWTLDYVVRQINKNKIDYSNQNRKLKTPQKLEFIINDRIKEYAITAQTNYVQEKNDLSFKLFKFTDFGKDWIKEHKFSPDSFCQMVIQLAYHKIHNQGCATYETAHTRQFYHGRTETLRSFSNESKKFVEVFNDPNATNEQKLEALRDGIIRHKKYLNTAMDGKACDRHLLGLRVLQLESGEQQHDFFNDISYKLSTTFKLSTSNMPANYYYPGFGPVCQDGYGLCYTIRKNEIAAIITARKSGNCSADTFHDVLCQCFRDVREVVELTDASKRAKL